MWVSKTNTNAFQIVYVDNYSLKSQELIRQFTESAINLWTYLIGGICLKKQRLVCDCGGYCFVVVIALILLRAILQIWRRRRKKIKKHKDSEFAWKLCFFFVLFAFKLEKKKKFKLFQCKNSSYILKIESWM